MEFVLELDGVGFHWQSQPLDRDRLVRWLRWRQPPIVELRNGSRRCRLGWQELEALLLRPDPREQAYRTLELPPGSDETAVRGAFRRLARLHHPDHGGTTARMQQINAAYRTLQSRPAASSAAAATAA